MNCAGNNFCGTVPSSLVGVVRDFVVDDCGQGCLTNVTAFVRKCSMPTVYYSRRLSYGVIAGNAVVLHSVFLCIQVSLVSLSTQAL